MGRPRKSAAILEMTGEIRNHPGRFAERGAEPQTQGPVGEPPEEFLRPSSDGVKHAALWRKLVAEAPVGLLTLSDREYLEAVCRMGIDAKRNGWKGQPRALEQYSRMLRGLGMTPEGRATRGLGGKAPTKTANPLESFRQTRRRAI